MPLQKNLLEILWWKTTHKICDRPCPRIAIASSSPRQCKCITIRDRTSPKGSAMSSALTPYSESTLTDRYQTTIPAPIRNALGLQKGDKLCYSIQSEGQVVISRAESIESDPILQKFLNFLAQDIEQNPYHLRTIGSDLVSHVQSLVADVDVDLDAPLCDEDE
jgi:antitoxin PrlF